MKLAGFRTIVSIAILGNIFNATASCTAPPNPPREGMWLPHLLGELNIREMHAMGFQLSAEDIYSVNAGSLKDAVMSFGGYCTASIISKEALVLTNHHCGYGEIAAHSTVERDLLTNGFWATEHNEELPCEGLFVTFIKEIRSVTAQMNSVLGPDLTPGQRRDAIRAKAAQLVAEATAGTHYGGEVKAFFAGNEFLLFITETFRDVRLVGTPPSSIGKFGGDTDNWMWPRHTADFSLFRVYAGADNKPAAYSPDNKPFRPRRVMPISLRGVAQNDFTFVLGFPGRTDKYLTSYGVDIIQNVQNPVRIALRTERLEILNRYSQQHDATRIMYADEIAGIANGWKKWIGQNRGLRRLGTIVEKQEAERHFQAWATENPERAKQYGDLLSQYKETYAQLNPIEKAGVWMTESAWSVLLMRHGWAFHKMLAGLPTELSDSALTDFVNKARAQMMGYHASRNPEVEQSLLAAMLRRYLENMPPAYRQPDLQARILREFGGGHGQWAAGILKSSVIADSAAFAKALSKPRRLRKILGQDPLVQWSRSLFGPYFETGAPKAEALRAKIAELDRTWLKALREMMEGQQNLYPDANFTLRVAYGKVEPYFPYDGAFYDYHTTLDGVIEKHDSLSTDYFNVPLRLRQLYANQDFGRYAHILPNGERQMRVAFCASNHTSGGNSGSPVLNARGELIGLNFDRNWEGTMSDIHYDPTLVRNIAADVRYVLFIIDKYANAGRLVEEMSLIP